MSTSSPTRNSLVGIQLTLVGIACLQIVGLENGPFVLFVAGISLVIAGTVATLSGSSSR